MIPKCNLHTHTLYCDGRHSVEEMVIAAIAEGCKTLGFSGHSPRPDNPWWCMAEPKLPRYIEDVKRCAAEYADKIEIVLGIEVDSHSVMDTTGFEYVIGSAHAIEKDGSYYDVDGTEDEMQETVKEQFGGDIFAYVKEYYDELCRLPEKQRFDIVGHFDLITKYNENFKYFDVNDPRYRKMALDTLDVFLEKDYIFEMNTGAISRGYRKQAYPADFILKRMVEKGAKIMLNSDCHARNAILFYFEDSSNVAQW